MQIAMGPSRHHGMAPQRLLLPVFELLREPGQPVRALDATNGACSVDKAKDMDLRPIASAPPQREREQADPQYSHEVPTHPR